MATEIQLVSAEEREWSTNAVREADISGWDLITDVLIGGYGGVGVCAAIVSPPARECRLREAALSVR